MNSGTCGQIRTSCKCTILEIYDINSCNLKSWIQLLLFIDVSERWYAR